ncbi:hypothetical protein AB7321_20465 [Providencia rettgeri]|uniref:hypothetical protein n=1 Tax=Providencia sp. PROV022 TaxID=2949757 RepID=UPI002349B574|nr:hypothetical protein [Providencia sp. PROV022]
MTFYLPGTYQTSCEEGEKYLCPQEVEEAIMTAGSNVEHLGLRFKVESAAE